MAVEDPGFPAVFHLLSALGMAAVPVGVDDAGPLPRDVEKALARGVNGLVVTTRAQNPFGSALDDRRARELRAVLRGHPDVLVIEDDHGGAVAGAKACTLAGSTERWAVARSVSKSLGPDLRLALLAGDAATWRAWKGASRSGFAGSAICCSAPPPRSSPTAASRRSCATPSAPTPSGVERSSPSSSGAASRPTAARA